MEASIAKLTEDITELTETWRQPKLGLRHPVRQPLGDLGPNQCEKTAVMHAIANKQLGYSPSMIHPVGISGYTSLQHAVLDEFSNFTYTIR